MQSEIVTGIGKPTALPVTFTSPNGVHWLCMVSQGKPIALTATRPGKEIKKGGFLSWLTNWPKEDLYLDSIAADPAGWSSFALDIWRACIMTMPESLLGEGRLVSLEKVRDVLAGRTATKPNSSPLTKKDIADLKTHIAEVIDKIKTVSA